MYSPLDATPPVTLQGLSAPVNALAWSPDGLTLAACAESGHVARWRGDERVASLRATQDALRQLDRALEASAGEMRWQLGTP